MKRFLIVILISGCVVNFSSAQIEKPITKGHMLIGGSLTTDFDKKKEYDNSSGSSPQTIYYTNSITFTTDLYCGFFIINQLSLGLRTDISATSMKAYSSLNAEKSKYSYYNLGLGPFVRYYTKLGVYAETFVSLGFLNSTGPSESSSWKNYTYGIGIGYSWFVNPSIAIEPQVNYVHQNSPEYLATNNEAKNDGINLSIGFQIYLNLKKQ